MNRHYQYRAAARRSTILALAFGAATCALIALAGIAATMAQSAPLTCILACMATLIGFAAAVHSRDARQAEYRAWLTKPDENDFL